MKMNVHVASPFRLFVQSIHDACVANEGQEQYNFSLARLGFDDTKMRDYFEADGYFRDMAAAGCFEKEPTSVGMDFVIRNVSIGKIRELMAKLDGIRERKQQSITVKHQPPQETNVQLEAGLLQSWSDGSITYEGRVVELRSQIKELCRLFMENQRRMVNGDDIRDRIIAANRRDSTPLKTIAKYVSELHDGLQRHYQHKVIFNVINEGWYFNPDGQSPT